MKSKIVILPLLVLNLFLISCGSTESQEFVPPTIEFSQLKSVDPGTEVPVESIVESTVLPTPTVEVPVPTVVLVAPPPTLGPPTPTAISVLPLPTPTPVPPYTGPTEGQLTPDGQQIWRNGAWQMINPPTATPLPRVTRTPTPSPTPSIPFTRTPIPLYSPVTTSQVAGTPDKLDFSSGPVVSGTTLSFSSTYTSRGLGTPTVVQLWQRNGSADALVSDANGNDCFTQKPVAFYRMAPARGMKYSKSVEINYPWSYCINDYRFAPTSLNIPWVESVSWQYNTQGVLETFTFEASIAGLANAFTPAGKWIVVIFAGETILSEQIIQ